jgi:hypothetical protein
MPTMYIWLSLLLMLVGVYSADATGNVVAGMPFILAGILLYLNREARPFW